MARRRRYESTGEYAMRELRRLVVQLVFAAIVFVLMVFVMAPLAAKLIVAGFTATMLHATPLPTT
jgi:hypothetical protein